jgi:hypothetical protein
MAGERHLAAAVEDAHAGGVRRIGGRQHERRLAEIELGGERLHVGVAHAARIGKHRQRIAAEAAVGEDVDSDEGEAGHLAIQCHPERSEGSMGSIDSSLRSG